MAGLDPAIQTHLDRAWMRGSSPRMTAETLLRRQVNLISLIGAARSA
jgi:hypothetical protein